MYNLSGDRSVGTKTKQTKERVSDVFDHSRIANFSDDIIGVLGWKGTGILACMIMIGSGLFYLLFH